MIISADGGDGDGDDEPYDLSSIVYFGFFPFFFLLPPPLLLLLSEEPNPLPPSANSAEVCGE